ncbi:Mg2+ transporter-C, MgtC family [Bacteriovorax sp. BSW11_IV]|uniref:MgtC/SapB family protein n=1 Tax=Bacteriovorax sp. BSW11_IV TaxID=1353529 RepID=UPI000389DF24|nr:MgtC/SapB family protein [Bacteriovorax sp. BSW11_IV]EQC49357.1 Mg2+ transporter-C, MgtC family [Bacteriovorax sp. BSW11_IV]
MVKMPLIHLEFLGEVPLYLGLGIEIVTAFCLGALIGFDREKKMKSAGIKTNIMICLGATLYTSMSMLNQSMAGGMSDPNRVAAQIVSGIGFLGAGAIIQGRGNVIGLTTAATIWVVAAIGMTVGSGYPLIATIFTLTILLVLKSLGPIYKLFETKKDYKFYHLEILSRGRVKTTVTKIVLTYLDEIYQMTEEVIDVSKDSRLLNIYFKLHPRKMQELTKEIGSVIRVEKVKFHVTDAIEEEED